MVML
jgi:hypothetical protein